MSVPPDTQALSTALQQLLQPLARLLLGSGLSYQDLDEMLRLALVDQARQLHADTPGHGLVSRISTSTGLSRREVSRLLALDRLATEPAGNLAAEVFARWLSDPEYPPRQLPRTGPAPSFDSLARSVSRDVHPRSLLDELCRLQLVATHADTDTVSLLRQAFVPAADKTQMLGLLGDNVGDHFAAAVENVLVRSDAHFEQAVFADELSARSVEALRPLISAQWKRLMARLVPVLEQHIADDRARGHAQDQRVRIGFYSFAAPVSPSTPEPAPGHAPAPSKSSDS